MPAGHTTHSDTNRRHFIKAAGAGGVAMFAGCLGDDDDTIGITSFAINVPGVIWSYLDDRTDILENHFDEAGYEVELNSGFDATTLFFAGQAEIATDMNSIEAARASVNRDEDLRILDRSQSVFLGQMTRAGSPYDPAESGGVGESFSALLEDDAQIGIYGWGLGDIPSYQITATRLTDGEFSPDGDYNVVTADAPAVPGLIEDGELDAGSSSPSHGAGAQLLDEDLVPVIFPSDFFAQQDWGVPSLENTIVREEFLEEETDACIAALEAWNEGVQWFFEDGPDEIPDDEEFREFLGTEDAEVAQWVIDWLIGEDVQWQYETDTEKVYRDNHLTDEWIADNRQFVETAEEIGEVPSGWEERVEWTDPRN